MKGKLSFDCPNDKDRMSRLDNSCGCTTYTVQDAKHAERNGCVAPRNNETTREEGPPPPDGQGASEESGVQERERDNLKVVTEVPEEGGGPEKTEGVEGTKGEGRTEEVKNEGIPIETPIAPVVADTSAPTMVSSHKTVTAEAKAGFKLEAASLRVRSSSASAAVRRVSMDQGLMSGQKNDRILQEKKRRRWSLNNNASNHFNNLPQVRANVFNTH